MKKANLTAKEAAGNFIKRLEGGGFTMSRPPSGGTPYSHKIAKRDSKAVAEFVKTDLFQDIMNLK
jgi:hypothetical protein